MINTNKKFYDYYVYDTEDDYGQLIIPEQYSGQLLMAIYELNYKTQNNILYDNATYLGLTQDEINDKYVIDYNGEKLKVLHVNPQGREKQVFMAVM